MDKRFKNIENLEFNRLTVKSCIPGGIFVIAECNCGKIGKFRRCDIVSHKTRSCGCLKKERNGNTKHLMTKTPEYRAWAAMKIRCYNKSDKAYHWYGGRGIHICRRWLNSFENFFADMGKKPTLKHSLDRIDSNKGYKPTNCRWSTPAQQANNTRRNRNIRFNKMNFTLSQLAKAYQINYWLLKSRLNNGWAVKDAIEKPSGISYGKLTPEIVKEIRTSYQNNLITQKTLAKKFGVCPQTISNIVLNKLWQHVK